MYTKLDQLNVIKDLISFLIPLIVVFLIPNNPYNCWKPCIGLTLNPEIILVVILSLVYCHYIYVKFSQICFMHCTLLPLMKKSPNGQACKMAQDIIIKRHIA